MTLRRKGFKPKKDMKYKRKTITLTMLAVMLLLFEPVAVHAEYEKNTMREQTWDILRGTYSAVVTDPFTSYKAKITLTYTYRYEPSNRSGKYITGILTASASNYYGWYRVSGGTVYQDQITYSANSQIATVPVSYKASTGAGYHDYHADITMNLLP